MKKTYMRPVTNLVKVIMQGQMMEASQVNNQPVTPTEGNDKEIWVGSKENGDWNNIWED